VVAQDVASLEGVIGNAATFDDRLDRAITWASDNEDRLATQIRILNEAAREQIWTDDGSVVGTYVKGMSRAIGLNVAAARSFYLHILGVVLQRMVDGNRTSMRRELSAFTDLLKASRKDVEGKVGKVASQTDEKPAGKAAGGKAGKAGKASGAKSMGSAKAKGKAGKAAGRKAAGRRK
jgi:hypothetical protein